MSARDERLERAPVPAAEPRQRWRVVFRRGPEAADLGGRDLQAAFENALAASGLPVVGVPVVAVAAGAGEAGWRPRLQFAIALAPGMAAEHELFDVVLTERWPVDAVRRALASALPAGHEVVDVHDVWLGEPALPAQARGAEYRIVIGPGAPSADTVSKAAATLLGRDRIERTRQKGDRVVRYDLRPLLANVVANEDDSEVVLRVVTLADAELGIGRPEEVIAALAEACGVERLEIVSIVRTNVSLSTDARG